MHTIDVDHPIGPAFEADGLADGTREPAKRVRIVGWITTGLLAAMMTVSGISFVLAPAPVAETFGHLGYPVYFARLLGLAKLLGVVALMAPRAGILREWAYAGFTFVLVAALLSHGLSGDGPGREVPAAFTLGLLLASYFLRRRSGFVLHRGMTMSRDEEVWRVDGARSRQKGRNHDRRRERPMTPVLRHSIWFGRLVLAGATILFSLIALRQITDPIGASTPHQIALGSSDAITIMRVTGGLFLGVALVLAACIASERRLLTGLGVLATVNSAVTAARVMGLVLDGPGPFTLQVLKPEVVLVTLSSIAFFVEWRRRRSLPDDPRAVPERGALGA